MATRSVPDCVDGQHDGISSWKCVYFFYSVAENFISSSVCETGSLGLLSFKGHGGEYGASYPSRVVARVSIEM
jgi:hypothetical protein